MIYRIGCTILAAGVPAFVWERMNHQVGYLGAGLIVGGALVSMLGPRLINR